MLRDAAHPCVVTKAACVSPNPVPYWAVHHGRYRLRTTSLAIVSGLAAQALCTMAVTSKALFCQRRVIPQCSIFATGGHPTLQHCRIEPEPQFQLLFFATTT